MKFILFFLIFIFILLIQIKICKMKFSKNILGIKNEFTNKKFEDSNRLYALKKALLKMRIMQDKNQNIKNINHTSHNTTTALGPASKSLDSNRTCAEDPKPIPKLNSSFREPPLKIIKRRLLKQPILIIQVPSPFCNDKWNYNKHGDDWICDCKEGCNQSPISLPELSKAVKNTKQTLFNFFPNDKDSDGDPLKLFFEDYKVKLKGKLGTILTWDYIKYEMYEMIFHTRSEHSINGKYFDLEIQIYYKAITPGYIRKSAALSILFEINPGSNNLFFDKDLNILDLPDNTDKTKILSHSIDLTHLFKTKEDHIYEPFSYYEYEGSITAPPCQEQTTWYVVGTPIPISYTTVEYFKDSIKALEIEDDKDCFKLDLNSIEEYTDNYRSTQKSNDRPVYYFEASCQLQEKRKEEKKPGHYEKIKEEVQKYFYVNDNIPTGIPNAFVVSEKEARNFLLT